MTFGRGGRWHLIAPRSCANGDRCPPCATIINVTVLQWLLDGQVSPAELTRTSGMELNVFLLFTLRHPARRATDKRCTRGETHLVMPGWSRRSPSTGGRRARRRVLHAARTHRAGKRILTYQGRDGKVRSPKFVILRSDTASFRRMAFPLTDVFEPRIQERETLLNSTSLRPKPVRRTASHLYSLPALLLLLATRCPCVGRMTIVEDPG